MNQGDLSPEVRRFLAERIDSAEQLDILLLLAKQAERDWTALEVSQAIYTVPASATMRLESLVSAGFVTSSGESDPGYRYAPESDPIRQQIAALAEAYRSDRVSVIKFIFAKPADPVQSFADAFRLRGGDK
ncbi:hypothetical protein BH23GEM6_BH23GEM6_21640 [soil metagenome]